MIQRHGAIIERANATDMLALVKSSHALDPTVFDDGRDPFFWHALISQNVLDAYSTKMMPSSLKNYRDDAEAGVSFQNSHRSSELPLGRSFGGKYTGPGGNGVATTRADFYTLPGLTLTGTSTDQFIDGVRSGIVKDVSIGFYGGTYRCTICNRDPSTDWSCWHYPGVEYELIDDKTGKKTGERKVATFEIENARLAEVSAVYDGACPGAMILRATRLVSEGRMPPATARLLEQRYRIAIPGANRAWAGAGEPPPPQEREMPEDPQTPPETPPPASPFGTPALRALMEAAGLPPGESDEHNLRVLTEAVKQLPAITAERERLAKEADDGRTYRADLIEATLSEGVRAYGATFPVEEYRAQFTGATLAFIKTNRDLWTAQAGEKLQPGRQSADVGDPEPPAPETVSAVQRMAYAAG